ncbi:hypothetical protein SAMN05444680_12030 [Variovorax sp. YR216]|nr:hypothetical protein SAMN05444680_12030 [Variovorax sp. YR216]
MKKEWPFESPSPRRRSGRPAMVSPRGESDFAVKLRRRSRTPPAVRNPPSRAAMGDADPDDGDVQPSARSHRSALCRPVRDCHHRRPRRRDCAARLRKSLRSLGGHWDRQGRSETRRWLDRNNRLRRIPFRAPKAQLPTATSHVLHERLVPRAMYVDDFGPDGACHHTERRAAGPSPSRPCVSQRMLDMRVQGLLICIKPDGYSFFPPPDPVLARS